MRKSTALLLTAALTALLADAAAHRAASEPSGPAYKTRELILLEEEKARLELEGKEVPGELLAKIEWESRYSEEMAAELEKREREIRELEDMRRRAPKDGKGNPRMTTPEFPAYAPEPYEHAGEAGDREYAESFFPRSFTYTRELVSAITASHDVLVSGVYRDDPGRGFIIRICNGEERGETCREQFDHDGAGEIRFTELVDDRIALFRYDGDREGFFDLAAGRAEFRPYEPQMPEPALRPVTPAPAPPPAAPRSP